VADVFSQQKRSEVMSRIRGRGNATTELAVLGLLRRNRITGWRRHLPLPGRPDFAFPKLRVASRQFAGRRLM
jgi:DNA mismatch endonuclease, patch repair protein